MVGCGLKPDHEDAPVKVKGVAAGLMVGCGLKPEGKRRRAPAAGVAAGLMVGCGLKHLRRRPRRGAPARGSRPDGRLWVETCGAAATSTAGARGSRPDGRLWVETRIRPRWSRRTRGGSRPDGRLWVETRLRPLGRVGSDVAAGLMVGCGLKQLRRRHDGMAWGRGSRFTSRLPYPPRTQPRPRE